MSGKRGPAQCVIAAALAGAVAACAMLPVAPPSTPAALPNGVTPQQMVASIRAAAAGSAAELDVQPLRDSQVEDLRQQAAALEAQGRYPDAAELLQQALAANPQDPAVMQEAAEAAVLLWQFDEAERLARRAYASGSGVGPLCRRHWAVVEQVAQARLALASVPPATRSRGNAVAQGQATVLAAQQARADAAAAKQAREACTVSAPQRF
ncbi:MAG TPA: tetratricopeptide repeat protein [Lysobacter sp.]|nr:tetratricopeptide repeat protein [Lysobacter sp.]